MTVSFSCAKCHSSDLQRTLDTALATYWRCRACGWRWLTEKQPASLTATSDCPHNVVHAICWRCVAKRQRLEFLIAREQPVPDAAFDLGPLDYFIDGHAVEIDEFDEAMQINSQFFPDDE